MIYNIYQEKREACQHLPNIYRRNVCVLSKIALPVVATARVSSTPAVSVSDELARLGALHAAAVIDAAEFSAAKAHVLSA